MGPKCLISKHCLAKQKYLITIQGTRSQEAVIQLFQWPLRTVNFFTEDTLFRTLFKNALTLRFVLSFCMEDSLRRTSLLSSSIVSKMKCMFIKRFWISTKGFPMTHILWASCAVSLQHCQASSTVG